MARLKKKTKRCSMKKELDNIYNDNHHLCSSGEDDRLSSLDDNILLTILSLIPFSSAVATSVLSHRWRHLWTYLTHISLKFFWFHEDNFHNFQNSITIINHVISKLASPKIHTFHLGMPFIRTQEQECSSLLALGVHGICLRNPEVIRLTTVGWPFINNYLCHLSSSLFKTQSLVELRLDSPFQFDFDDDAPLVINLPNLKILRMSLCVSNHRLMHTLLKSCPLLECLHLSLKDNDLHADISAPNLKLLTVESYVNNYVLSIDAPKLVNLNTYGRGGSVLYHFVKILRCLQEATIIIPEYHVGHENDYLSRILALFQGISCARSLTFDRCFDNDLLDAVLPSFPHLIDISFDDLYLSSRSWMPICLLSNVKSLCICMKPNDYGIRLLRDILSNATVLEQLQVSIEYSGDSALETVCKEFKFATKLFKLPRNSSSCQIKLSGEMVNLSCEDFTNGQLTGLLSDSDSE